MSNNTAADQARPVEEVTAPLKLSNGTGSNRFPTVPQIRARAAPELDEYSEFISLVHDLLGEQAVEDDVETFMEVLAELDSISSRCRDKRLQVSRASKARVKDVENIFHPTERAITKTLERVKIELGKVLPEDRVELVAASVQSSELDWEALGPYLSETTVVRAANKYLTSTGHRLSGIDYAAMAIPE